MFQMNQTMNLYSKGTVVNPEIKGGWQTESARETIMAGILRENNPVIGNTVFYIMRTSGT